MPREWRFSTVIPLYKNKVDIRDCNNYRDIKLLNHTIKLCERVIERRLRKNISISENVIHISTFKRARAYILSISIIRRLFFYGTSTSKRTIRQTVNCITVHVPSSFLRQFASKHIYLQSRRPQNASFWAC